MLNKYCVLLFLSTVGCGVSGQPTQLVPAQARRSLSSNLENMLCRVDIHGFDTQDFGAFSAEDIDGVRALLGDPSRSACWNSALLVLANIGGEVSWTWLRDHLNNLSYQQARDSGASAQILWEQPIAVAAAFRIYLDRNPESVDAIEFLVRASNPGYWLTTSPPFIRDAALANPTTSQDKAAFRTSMAMVRALRASSSNAGPAAGLRTISGDHNIPQSIRDLAGQSLRQ